MDNEPLQREAWAEFDEARRRQEKASRDLHRHEQVDVPAFETWLHRTFPTLITKLRNLHEEVATKARQVESVQAMASLTGRSPKKLWREHKAYEANPEAFEKRSEEENSFEDEDRRRRPDDEDFFGNRGSTGDSWQGFRRSFESEDSTRRRTPSDEAKSIYRRLVQRLHPDRGGDFTPDRIRLWHEVQQAWAVRDTDWLSRLEIEWETAN
ncbi:MAG: J domain-containing protein, partial [Opitutus sp.]